MAGASGGLRWLWCGLENDLEEAQGHRCRSRNILMGGLESPGPFLVGELHQDFVMSRKR